MGAIGVVEEAHGVAEGVLALLVDAADAADDEGRQEVADDLRELHGELDDVAYRIGQQREALRA